MATQDESMTLRVTKRDGTLQSVSYDKIVSRIASIAAETPAGKTPLTHVNPVLVAQKVIPEEHCQLVPIAIYLINGIVGPANRTGNSTYDDPAVPCLRDGWQYIFAVCHFRGEETTGSIGVPKEKTVGFPVKLYLTLRLIMWHKWQYGVILSCTSDLNLPFLC